MEQLEELRQEVADLRREEAVLDAHCADMQAENRKAIEAETSKQCVIIGIGGDLGWNWGVGMVLVCMVYGKYGYV